MKVDNIRLTNFGARVNIKSVDNKNNPYLYNVIKNLTNEYKIPANFRTHEIELPSVSTAIIARLNELKIKFSNK